MAVAAATMWRSGADTGFEKGGGQTVEGNVLGRH